MGLFGRKKQKSDVVDLRSLESVKRARRLIPTDSSTATPYYDSSSSSSTTSSSADSTAMGFLGDLAGAAQSGATETNQSSSSYPQSSSYSSYNPSGYASSYSSNDVSEQIEMIHQQLYKIIQRLELLELKINKIERKGGYY